MELYGKNWKRRELEARVGRTGQVAGIRRTRLCEGVEDGVEIIEVRTGTGLRFTVSPHHALDMAVLEYCGTPLSWQTQNGDKHPAYFEHKHLEWLRCAAGGMLFTCGFSQAGAPCEDAGEALGLHGRAHHIPAAQVSINETWVGDDLEFTVSGVVTETRLFGENISMHRSYTTCAGSNAVTLRDRFRNNGFESVPFMLLYHWNFGFPLLAEGTTLKFPSGKIAPREPEIPLEGHDRWDAPIHGYKEHVYFHSDLKTELQNGRAMACAEILNPVFPIGAGACPLKVKVQWSADTLPELVQWKMPGESMHVLGIEPANCQVRGRAEERARGTLKFLEPGEEVDTINILEIS